MFGDLVVLDLAQVFAGPLATRLLAELGATVIKVERPSGDVSRQLPWRANGRSGYFVQQNRGKLGIALDLKSEAGQQQLWKLIESADVLVDGFAPGVLAKFGFTYASMSACNPRLVVCEMSALGRDGPLGMSRGYDPIGACYSGVAYSMSPAGSMPTMPSVSMGDAMMAMAAYGGIVSALYERKDSGLGQRIEVSLVDSYIQCHSNNIEAFSISGGRIDSRPVGGQNATVCPSGVFGTPDGRWMYIVALSNEEWARICACLDRPDLVDDSRYNSNEARMANRDEVLELLHAWLAACGTREIAMSALLAAGVAAAPVLSIGEVIDEPQLRERGTIEIVDDPALGRFAVPGPPFKLSRTGRRPLAPAPELNEHASEVVGRYASEASADPGEMR